QQSSRMPRVLKISRALHFDRSRMRNSCVAAALRPRTLARETPTPVMAPIVGAPRATTAVGALSGRIGRMIAAPSDKSAGAARRATKVAETTSARRAGAVEGIPARTKVAAADLAGTAPMRASAHTAVGALARLPPLTCPLAGGERRIGEAAFAAAFPADAP